MIFKYLSQFFTEAYQDREILNNVFFKKYDADEKYIQFHKSIKFLLNSKKKYKPDFQIIEKTNNLNNVNIFNENKVEMISNPEIGIQQKKVKFFPIININEKEVKFNEKNKNIFTNSVSPNNIEKSFAKLNEPQRCIIHRQIDTINNKKRVYKSVDYYIDKLKNFKTVIAEKLKNNGKMDENSNEKGGNFPYCSYLLNIFNKSFGVKEMKCVNQKFKDAWKYFINVFDVSKFIEMQINIDLVNKILFQIKIDGMLSSQGNTENKLLNKTL